MSWWFGGGTPAALMGVDPSSGVDWCRSGFKPGFSPGPALPGLPNGSLASAMSLRVSMNASWFVIWPICPLEIESRLRRGTPSLELYDNIMVESKMGGFVIG